MHNHVNYIFPNTTYIDLTLYQYGMESCRSMQSFGPAIRNHYLLHYIISGSGKFHSFKDKYYYLEPGQAFLITPNTVNTYYADEKHPWCYMWIEFDGLKAQEYLNDAGITEDSPIYKPIKGLESNDLKKHMTYLMEHPDASPVQIIGTLYHIMDALIRTSSSRNVSTVGNLREFYTREAINFIEQNYNKNISITDIANFCNLNRSYFGKIFKDTMHVTPQDFLIKYRMNRACDYLSNTNYPINTIAQIVGYDNPLHFSRAFRNTYNVSPRDWRKNHASITHSNEE